MTQRLRDLIQLCDEGSPVSVADVMAELSNVERLLGVPVTAPSAGRFDTL